MTAPAATAAATSSLLDDLFAALADPTRRQLLQRLLQHGPDAATRLAEASPMTRQAVVKHLQALVEAGLAIARRDGREVRYVATPEPLASAVSWLTQTGPEWDRRLDRLRARAASQNRSQ